MKHLFRIIILPLLLSCSGKDHISPQSYDHKVQSYYLIASDITYSERTHNNIIFTMDEMRKWYQVSTAGLTFEYLNNDEIVKLIYLNNELDYYKSDYWKKIKQELLSQGVPMDGDGIINYIWLGGVSTIDQNEEIEIIGLGGTCNSDLCGQALVGTDLLVDVAFYTNLGTAFHEMGHALGLSHPLEIEDLPTNSEDSAMLWSVMSQSAIRLSQEHRQLGLLTNEKKTLLESDFMKTGIQLNYARYQTKHINYPITDQIPSVDFGYSKADLTVVFEVLTKEEENYFWQFGDGITSIEKNPEHQYSEAKNYYVTLTATSNECMSTTVGGVVYLE